ncbi:MAG: hypothetical protein ACLQU2_17535 [Candidatus Binataceae bacterium]
MTIALALIVGAGFAAVGAIAWAAQASVGGVYALDAVANNSINAQVLTNPDVDGIVLRFGWTAIETRDGVFNWKQLDSQIAQAAAHGKKVSIGIFATAHLRGSISKGLSDSPLYGTSSGDRRCAASRPSRFHGTRSFSQGGPPLFERSANATIRTRS